jgi:hypothetical protein
MISVRLNNCENCTTIPVLLNNIDCKLTELAKQQYGNIVFALNQSFSSDIMLDLLNYKRILTNKSCNADYANPYSIDQIANRVKILIHK